MEKRQDSSISVAVKSGYLSAETETRFMSITLYWYQLRMDEGPKYQT
jgi:hypothetical protein